MLRKTIFTLLALLTLHTVNAQKLEVKSLSLEQHDPAATQFPVKDGNGQNCALIIVGLAVDSVEFEGNIIKQERKQNGEYWVYITDGSMDFQINSTKYLPEPVDFATLGVESVRSGATYRMNVERPILEATFDDFLATARQYYQDYPQHADFNFYEAANVAYKNVINHNDCPMDQRETYRSEMDRLLAIRRDVYLIEQAAQRVQQAEAKEGFSCSDVYKYLGAQVTFADRILKNYPECTAVAGLRDRVQARQQTHPDSKVEAGTETIVRQREQLSGTVSFKNPYMAKPFDKMRVYASPTQKIQGARSRIIGSIKADGTYSVVKPDDITPLYVYVSGEKDDAHYVPQGTTHLDIVVK